MAGKNLIKHLQFIELLGKGLTIDDVSYIPEDVKVYSDLLFLRILRITNQNSSTLEFNIPLTVDARFVPICADETKLRWDIADDALRFSPSFNPSIEAKLNPWVSILDSRVIRIDREYALRNLTPACLRYCFSEDQNNFDWCITDYSCIPVVFELLPLFEEMYNVFSDTYLSAHVQENFSLLSMHAHSYLESADLTADNFIELYLIQKKRSLWTPDPPTKTTEF